MKSFGNTIKIITLAFACVFILNMLIMHVFFNTDVFNPVSRDQSETDIAGLLFYPENTADSDSMQEEAYPESTPAATDGYYQQENNDAAAPEKDDIQAAGEGAGPDSTFFMTTGEVGFLENLSILDKLEALSLISKVGREEADKIYDLAMDGVTYAEMKDIEAILKEYLDQEEMDKLTGLLEKNKKQYSVAGE